MTTFLAGGGSKVPGMVITLLGGGQGIFGGTSRTINGSFSPGISGTCRMITFLLKII